MPDASVITKLLLTEGIPLAGPVVYDESNGGKYIAFVNITRSENNLQQPSNSRLNEIKVVHSNYIPNIEFILIDTKNNNIESDMRSNLLYRHRSSIRNSFLSTKGRKASIWLVPKTNLSEAQLAEIRTTIIDFLKRFNVDLSAIYITSEQNIPSKTACLSVIRNLSPASIETISRALTEKGFVVPTSDWLRRMMDNLRKGGLIVRLRSGAYALSSAGLKAGGTAKNSRSPDVRRVLDLARRQS